jgi:hypothetical protein
MDSTPPPPPSSCRSVLDTYAAISGSRATAPWRPPAFSKRERSPEPSNSSPVHHKRLRTEDFPSSPFGTRDLPATSSPFGTRDLPATSSPFGTPPRYTPSVPRSPIKESLYEKQERLWADYISTIMDDILENSVDLRSASLRQSHPRHRLTL